MKESHGKPKQARKFAIVTYLDPSLIDKALQAHAEQIREFAYMVHDQDRNEDGTPQIQHTHLLLWLNVPYLESSIKNWFRGNDITGNPANTLTQICRDHVSYYRYLTHADNPEKHQYDPHDIVCTNPAAFEDGDQPTEDTSWMALSDILDGVPLREVARRYGRDFIYHYGHIDQLIKAIRAEEGQ